MRFHHGRASISYITHDFLRWTPYTLPKQEQYQLVQFPRRSMEHIFIFLSFLLLVISYVLLVIGYWLCVINYILFAIFYVCYVINKQKVYTVAYQNHIFPHGTDHYN